MKFLTLALLSISMMASAQQYGRGNERGRGPGHGGQHGRQDKVCFYAHAGYQSSSFCLEEGEETFDLSRQYGMNDQISSIRIFGQARVVIYVDAGMRGDSVVIDSDVYDLSDLRRRSSVCFYSDSKYQGALFCIDETDRMQNIQNLSRVRGFNEKISSIRINGRASVSVYEHANMSGQRSTKTFKT